MMSLKDLQAELTAEYKTKYESYVLIAYYANKVVDKQIFDMATKKAGGLKMMIDYTQSDENPINKQP